MLHNLCMVTWNMYVTVQQNLCVAVIPFVHMHQYINLCPYLTAHVCSTQFEQFHENMGAPVWHCVFVTINLFLVTHLCQNVYMHQVHVFMFIWLPISVWYPVDSYMERCVPLCSTACVYSNYSISGNVPWLEFVHASVHVFMSIWLLVSPQTPMHSYTDPWEPPCGSAFVSQSPHYVASTCMECEHASVHVLMWMWVLKIAPSPIHSDMETWVSVCGPLYVAVFSFLFLCLV